MIHRTLSCLQKKARIVIPQLSPTLTRARIYKWCKSPSDDTIECYEPIFVLECSEDLVTPGYRDRAIKYPLMIVEAHDEGTLKIHENIQLNVWYDVGHSVGEIIDEEDDDDTVNDWLWQAYSYTEEKSS